MPAITATITITTIPNQVQGVPFTVSGTIQLNQSTWADNLVYEDNGGTQVPIPASSVTLGVSTFSYTHPGNLAPGTHTVTVRDPLTGTVAVSNTFTVGSGHAISENAINGAIAGQQFYFTGTLTNYTSAPTLTYQLVGPQGGVTPTPTPTPTVAVPTQASAVGYNTQTFGPTLTLGTNVFPFNFYGVTGAGPATQNSDGSITFASGGDNYGAQLCLAQSNGAPGTGVFATTGSFKGTTFGGGAYLECTMSSSGPMSFWANDIETMNGTSPGVGLGPNPWPGQASGYGDWIECDIAEFGTTGVYGIAIHNWYAAVNSGNDTNTGAISGSPVTPAGSPNYTQPNKYGFLWVPATGGGSGNTNIITNSVGTGGSAGSPGTLPTGWSVYTTSGLTVSVVSITADTTTGNNKVTLGFTGTSNGGDININFASTAPAGIVGQTYTQQVTLNLASGSLPSGATGFAATDELGSGQSYLATIGYQFLTLTSSPATYPNTITATNSSTQYLSYHIGITGMTNGVSCSFQLTIEAPALLMPTISTQGQGYAKFFFNGVQVGNTINWSKYNSSLPPPPSTGAYTAFSILDQLHLAPIWGTGTGGTTRVYSLNVWQASASNNITSLPAVTNPTPTPTTSSTTVSGAVTGVNTTGWSMPFTVATAGTYTITVSDGTINSQTATFTVSPVTVIHTITPAVPGSVTAGATFSFTGTLTNYTSPPSLTYAINGASPVVVTGVTSTGWQMNLVAPSTAGSYNISVTDGTTSGSVTLTVLAAAKVITPIAPSGAKAGQSFTFQGTLSGYTTIPALTYTISPGGSATALTGVSITGWSMTIAVATAGNYTVTVSDGTNTSSPVSFTVAQQTTTLRNWYQNPGMDGSFWVQPFQSSANWITSGSLITALRGGSPSVNLNGNYSVPWYIGQLTDPTVTVTDGTHSIVVHIPVGAFVETPASGYDQSIGGADATQPYLVWSISDATIYNSSGSVVSTVTGSGCTIKGTYGFAVQDGSGLIMVDAVTQAPGDNNSIGNIQDYELSQITASSTYVIPHMLAFQLDSSLQAGTNGVWPLLLTDTSNGSYPGPIPQGVTIGIPASVARPTGQTRGFYALWDQAQQFGLFNYNFGATGGVNISICSVSGNYSSLVSQMVTAWPTVAQSLCILNYNSGVSGAQYSLATTKGAIPGSTNAFPAPPPLDLSPTGGKNVAPSTFGAWYPSGYNVTPTNSTNTATFIISPNTPSNVVVNTPFTFSGNLSGYTAAPNLTYSINGGTATALGGVSATAWSTTLTIPAAGETTVVVTDSANVVSGSVSFNVTTTVVTNTPVTWNPSAIQGALTLSNSNYTATTNGSATAYGAPQGVIANAALSTTAIVLWEVTFTTITQNTASGVADASANLAQTVGMGFDTNSIGFYPSTGTGSQPAQTVYFNDGQLTSGNGVSTTAGGVVTFVTNGTNLFASDAAMRSTSGVQWNNSTSADPASNTGGFSFAGMATPYYPAMFAGEGGCVAVLNDGTSALSSFAQAYLAAHPNVVTLSGSVVQASKTISPAAPSGVVPGAPFTFTGTLTGYSAAPTLTYSLNGGAATALGGVTASGWSATLVTQVNGSNTISVTDGTVTGSVTFTASQSGGNNRVVAPLTGTVTTGTWQTGLKFTSANSPSGAGYMQYNVLLPSGYSSSLLYPLLLVGHPNDDGMNGSSYPLNGSTFVTGAAYGSSYSLDSMYNTVDFRTNFPCIIVAPQCDQSLDLSGANGNANFGGYNDSQNSGWNENAVIGIVQALVSQYSIDPGRRYIIGYSLGGIGTLAQLADNNQYNGPGTKLWTAGATYSDQLYRPSAPNTGIFSRMSSVPLCVVSTSSDNNPASYDQPAWQSYTGNSNYPTQSNYDSSGMPGIRAGTTQFYYINYGSGNPATTFMPTNNNGGDGTAIYNWLFSQIYGGTGPSITGVSFTPASSVKANSAKSMVAGSLSAGASGGSLTGITYTCSPTTSFTVSGSNLVFNSATVAAGTYPLTVTVAATNASNSPQSYSVTVNVTGTSTSTYFKVSGGKVLTPSGATFKGLGIAIYDYNLTSVVTNAACQPLTTLFPGINFVRISVETSGWWTPSTYAQQINWLTALNIVCVIENHIASNGNTGGGGQGVVYTGTMLSQEQAWYSSCASYFINNPYVWFGTNNEPSTSPSLSALWAWQQQTYNTIRATGNGTIVEIEQPNPYQQGSNSGLSNTVFSQMTNIVYGPHYYSWIWNGNGSTVVSQATIYSSAIGSTNSQYGGIVQQVQTLQTLTSLDGVVPCGCFEFGPSTTGTGTDASGMNDVNAVIEAVNNGVLFGFLAWVWISSSSDNLLATSTTLSNPYGVTVAAAIQPNAGPTAPAYAQAAGYTQVTLGPNIYCNTTNVDPVTSYPTFSGNTNWVPFTFFGNTWTSTITVTNNSDGSITLSGSGQHDGEGISSAAAGNGNLTNNPLTFTGKAFGGGWYAEAVMKSNGPMSFWANDLETMNGVSVGYGPNPWPGQGSGYGDWIEFDIAEFDDPSSYGLACHNWYGSVGSGVQTNTQFSKVQFASGQTPDFANTWHRYGGLWIPATNSSPGSFTYYFDGNPVAKIQWGIYNPANAPPPYDPYENNYNQNIIYPSVQPGGGTNSSAYGVADKLHFVFILGGAPGYNTNIQSVTVWQNPSTMANLVGTGQ